MKRILIPIILLLLSGVCMAKPKIISSEPCEYRDVSCDFYGYQKWFKEEVSYNKALEDLDMFVYLLKTAYSGYEDAVERGLQIDKIIDLFKQSYKENEKVKVSSLSQFIYEYLKPYIQDCHFCIESKNFQKSLVTQYIVLYSNIYVKKDDKCVVVKSDNSDIQVGETIECKNENLFLYPSEGKNIYRLATYATLEEKSKEIDVMYSDKQVQIICNVSNNYLCTNDLTLYKEIETKDSVYIYIPTLMDLDIKDSRKSTIDDNLKKLHSISERYQEKKNIILDLRTNGGGNSLHTTNFLANLYFLEKNCDEKNTIKNVEKLSKLIVYSDEKKSLMSPPILQVEDYLTKNVFEQNSMWKNKFIKRKRLLNNRNVRILYSEYNQVKIKARIPNFNGKLIILTGKNSASSSELALIEATKVFSKTNQLFQIGENTSGCNSYGNVYCYQLINTGIAVHLASYIANYFNKTQEGIGIIPNYWATNDDIQKALVNVTGDEELLESLQDINNNL